MMVIENNLLSLKKLKEISQQELLKPFSTILLNFVDALSNEILLSKISRSYTELMAMAHWLRKAHLIEIQKEFESRRQDRILLARGTALHFAPANVDTIFMYSWILSLLVGNNNIVRLSSRGSDQVNVLLSFIEKLLIEPQFQIIKSKNVLLQYQRNDEITKKLSSFCDLRIIWGGDESVKAIRKISLSPHAKEIVFSNKFSMAMLKAQAVVQAEKSALEKLIHQFYNDSFWFDQLACSSPRIVIWLGETKTVQRARNIFWQALNHYCETRNITVEPARQMIRMAHLFEFAAKNKLKKSALLPIDSNYFAHYEIRELDDSIRQDHQGGQLFLEYHLHTLEELTPLLRRKDQTLSIYGIEHKEIRSWIQSLPQPAFDRVVPIGEALNFQTTWDGYSLLQELTREVMVTSV